MIRRIMLASAALITASGAVLAADLPARTRAPMPYAAAPVFTWTGFYIGANVGAAFGNSNSRRLTPFYAAGAPAGVTTYTDATTYNNNNNTGFVGGGQIGYNWQASAFVFGVEADLQYRGRGGNSYSSVIPAAPPAANTLYGQNSGNLSNYFGTVRGRLGFAVDRALFYVTGGFAYGGHQGGATARYYDNTAGAYSTYTSTGNRGGAGYALGGGIEYAITPNWTVKGEYLYVDLGKKGSNLYAATTPAATAPVYIATGNKGDRFSVARVGFNYKF